MFVSTGDTKVSAEEAGFGKNSLSTGEKLLCREDITEEIERLERQRGRILSAVASAGYRKLAFGDISDAVALLYMDNPTKRELKEMDLYSVSEIKKPKDGSMEIKFFDRLKALEKLESKSSGKGEVKSLFDAIGKSAEAAGSAQND